MDLINRGLSTRIIILSESQAALRRTLRPRAPKPGQYLFLKFLHLLTLIPKDTDVTLKWCPGHSNIPGNEAADALADSAAKDDCDPGPPSLDLRTNALKAFKRPPPSPSRRLRSTCPTDFPVSAAIHQLRSGHVRLNAYLFRCKQAHYPICDRCGVLESVNHYLTSCKRFIKEREALRATLRRNRLRTQYLSSNYLLHNPITQAPLITHIKQNSRLPATSGSYFTPKRPPRQANS